MFLYQTYNQLLIHLLFGMKPFLSLIPEIYFLTIILLAAYTPPFSWNPTLFVLALLVAAQLVLRNRVYGLLMASAFFLTNILFLAAVLSEFNEFISINKDGYQLIIIGSIIFLLNLLMSLALFFKYVRMTRIKKFEKTESIR